MRRVLYFDYAASTPVDKKVFSAMAPFLKKEYGNPSSQHSYGQKASSAIEEARKEVALLLHADPGEIVFTSGATEANNLALRGAVAGKTGKRIPHIVTTAIEHESVLQVAEDLQEQGLATLTTVPVGKDGVVKIPELLRAIQQNTVLVSVMYANSEIGTIQPIEEIGVILKKRYPHVLFHTDAVQALQFLDCNVHRLNADLLTLSSHKIYGPKGVGALYVRKGIPIRPLQEGGGQEGGMRSGTENVPGIVGLGVAVRELRSPKTAVTAVRMRQMRDKITRFVLRKIQGSFLNGSEKERLPNNVNLRFRGILGSDLVLSMDRRRIALSTGSACSERTQEPSHVLKALGLSSKEAQSAIRITLGKQTTFQEVEELCRQLPGAVDRLRKDGI